MPARRRASGNRSGTSASGNRSGTSASGNRSGTSASGNRSGTSASGNRSGTSASGNRSGTSASGNRSGTSASGNRSGTSASGNRSGTSASGKDIPTPQYTLTTLVAELHERAKAGEPQDSLVEWLHSLTSSLGIRMRFDEYKTVDTNSKTTITDETSAESSVNPPPTQLVPETPTIVGIPTIVAKEGINTDDISEADTSNNDFQKSDKCSHGSRQKTRKIPIIIKRGHMSIQFDDDAALQEHDPLATGCFNHLSEGDTFVGRIVLSCNRRNTRINSPLYAECNGAVINARTWTHLVVPPRAFISRPSVKEVNSALAVHDCDDIIRTGHYDIIQVSDGTIVTLYCWTHPVKGPIWCLASSNGYDVSHLKWMGDKTYAEIVYELLVDHPGFQIEVGLELRRNFLGRNDVRLNFKHLDKDHCYTIGFRHSNFHPMGADPSAIWNIQVADLVTGIPKYSTSTDKVTIGLPIIPRQAIYSREDIIRLAGIRQGVGFGKSGLRMEDLNNISRTALKDAKDIIEGVTPTIPPLTQLFPPDRSTGVHISPFNYGFILRSRNPEATGVYSDILCESPLLRRVRQLVYQRHSRQMREELNESSRMEYNALKAYLTVTDRDDFLALFPEFKPRFDIYEQFVNNVIRLVIQMQRQNSMVPSTRSSEDSQPHTQTKTVARAILTHILCHEKDFNSFNRNTRSVVHDFVVRPEYAVLYLRAIGISSNKK